MNPYYLFTVRKKPFNLIERRIYNTASGKKIRCERQRTWKTIKEVRAGGGSAEQWHLAFSVSCEEYKNI